MPWVWVCIFKLLIIYWLTVATNDGISKKPVGILNEPILQIFKRVNSEQRLETYGGLDNMANEGTPSTLVLIGAIIQIIFVLLFGGLAGLFAIAIPLFPTLSPSEIPPGVTLAELIFVSQLMLGYFVIGAVLSLIFTIVWFMWRAQPSQHRVGLIITGILGLIFTGFLPGLLVLIGGAIAKTEPKTYAAPAPAASTTAPPVETAKFCASCGNPIDPPDAQFCGVCGAATS
jgi:hypothetical protein